MWSVTQARLQLLFPAHCWQTETSTTSTMSRLKNFSRNLATSYLQLGVNVVYSLVSVPLILHWLPKAEFGLWSTLVQLMSYITLVDLGVNSAIARFLVDHKDQRGSGEYGALVKTSALVSAVQGLIVLLVVTLGSPILASLIKVPAEFQATFINLMRIQGLIAAFAFCMNPLAIMLNAHQRMDVVTRQGMITLVVSLVLLLSFLAKNCGIYAFVYANAITVVVMPWHLLWHCRRLGYLPRRGESGRVTWKMFKEVFLYGKDVFLMNLGIQLITASQIIVLSRSLGLDVAAAWTVGTKIFMLVRQIMYQPSAAATAGLCEMMARNEAERLKQRFRNLVVLTASLGAFSGVAYALCNSLFVQIWTNGKIVWPPLNDVLLGLWIFVASLQTTHCSFVTVTKQIGRLPYVFVLEGCTFITVSLLFAYRWGVPGIVACSVLCLSLFSCQFCLRKSSRFFHLSLREITVEWVLPSWKLVAILTPAALLIFFATAELPAAGRLLIHGVAIALVGGLLFLRLGLPSEIIRDIGSRLPRPAARLLELLAPRTI